MYDPRTQWHGQALFDARMSAWTILLGQHNVLAEHRRPHRGMLPDFDFSHAEPVPKRPSLLRRLARLFQPDGIRRSLAGAARGDAGEAPVGEADAPSYIAQDRPGGPDIPAGPSGLVAKLPRAA